MIHIEAHLHNLLYHHGSLALFSLLAFGIIGLPVPDETLLIASGVIAAKGISPISFIILAAIAGTCCGITVSYLLGRYIGHHALVRYGKYVGITEDKVKKTHNWFEKIGKYLLFIGYFIPGVRHLTGLIAGTAELNYRSFALFAYLGAICWSLLFIFIGYFFFNQWQHWSF